MNKRKNELFKKFKNFKKNLQFLNFLKIKLKIQVGFKFESINEQINIRIDSN